MTIPRFQPPIPSQVHVLDKTCPNFVILHRETGKVSGKACDMSIKIVMLPVKKPMGWYINSFNTSTSAKTRTTWHSNPRVISQIPNLWDLEQRGHTTEVQQRVYRWKMTVGRLSFWGWYIFWGELLNFQGLKVLNSTPKLQACDGRLVFGMVLDPLATTELGASQQSNHPPRMRNHMKSWEITHRWLANIQVIGNFLTLYSKKHLFISFESMSIGSRL